MSFQRTLMLAIIALSCATKSTGIDATSQSQTFPTNTLAVLVQAMAVEMTSKVEAVERWIQASSLSRLPQFSDHDLDLLSRTVYGEARSQSPQEIQAVVNVIYNRWKLRLWGKTIKDVVLSPKQFSTWNRHDPNWSVVSDKRIDRLSDYQRIREFVTFSLYARHYGLLADNSNGATHYFHPKSMKVSYVRTRGKTVRTSQTPHWAATYIYRSQIGDGVFLRKI